MNKKLVTSVVSATLFLAATALADTKNPVVGGYFQVEHAVINGDLNTIRAAASDLAQKARAAKDDAIVKDADQLAKAESIDQARQLFNTLSEETQNLIQTGESDQNMACSMGGTQSTQSDNPCSGMVSQKPSCGAMMGMMRRCMQSSGCGGMGG